jgi:hypothetical protein
VGYVAQEERVAVVHSIEFILVLTRLNSAQDKTYFVVSACVAAGLSSADLIIFMTACHRFIDRDRYLSVSCTNHIVRSGWTHIKNATKTCFILNQLLVASKAYVQAF